MINIGNMIRSIPKSIYGLFYYVDQTSNPQIITGSIQNTLDVTVGRDLTIGLGTLANGDITCKSNINSVEYQTGRKSGCAGWMDRSVTIRVGKPMTYEYMTDHLINYTGDDFQMYYDSSIGQYYIWCLSDMPQAYKIDWHLSYSTRDPESNEFLAVFVNDNQINESVMGQSTKFRDQLDTMSGTVVVELYAGYVIQFRMTSDIEHDITVSHMTYTINELYD